MRSLTVSLAVLTALALGACSSTNDTRSSGLAESFSLSNYKASGDTNGTQTRRDVNRAYTQPSLPTIANRGM